MQHCHLETIDIKLRRFRQIDSYVVVALDCYDRRESGEFVDNGRDTDVAGVKNQVGARQMPGDSGRTGLPKTWCVSVTYDGYTHHVIKVSD